MLTDHDIAQAMNARSLQDGNNDSPWWLLFARDIERAASADLTGLRELADSEGTRAVDCLRRARNAETEARSLRLRYGVVSGWIVQALKVLDTLDPENTEEADELRKLIHAGEMLALTTLATSKAVSDDQAFDSNAERITREALGEDVTRPINPHATSIDDL